MDMFKHASNKFIGIGGIKCDCCNRFKRNHKALRRHARRSMPKVEVETHYEENAYIEALNALDESAARYEQALADRDYSAYRHYDRQIVINMEKLGIAV
jgi:hypothetical protein